MNTDMYFLEHNFKKKDELETYCRLEGFDPLYIRACSFFRKKKVRLAREKQTDAKICARSLPEVNC